MLFRIYSAIAFFISRFILKTILVLFFGFKVQGGGNIPKKGPLIIASNHVSYMDPPIVASACKRRVHFITSDHLYRKNRLMALWYTSVGCLRIKRDEPGPGAIRKTLDYLKAGRAIALFPEGTRSEDGTMKDPQAGIGFLALKSGAPVIPCLIKGSDKALPKGSKAFRRADICVYIGKPIEAKGFGQKRDRETYRLFAKTVMDKIASLEGSYGS